MSNTKLATFRIDEQTWEQFITRAKEAGSNATNVLTQTIHSYLDGQKIAESESQPGIYLAIAPDNQITYIDRAVKSAQWLPPYQLRQSDSRYEWVQSTDHTLLSAIEDVLIAAFQPPLNFRPKTQSTPLEFQIDKDPYHIPTEIAAKIQHLLTSGFSTLDILSSLESLSQPKPHIQVPPEPPSQPDTIPQVDNAIVQHLEALTQSIINLKQDVNQRIDAVETQFKQHRKVKEFSPKSEKIQEQTPQLLKGTASLDELPKHPESTRSLATRWQISEKTLTRQRQRYEKRPEGFFQYSLKKEQGKFAWIYDTNNQLFYAVTELPESTKKPEDSTPGATIHSTKDTTKDLDLPKPLTAEQLGHRFRNPKTHRPISGRSIEKALKRHENPEDFAQYCRQRDPEGYGWQFDENTKVFMVIETART
jgi:hypothetical protein